MTVDIDLEYVRQEYNRMESDQSSCDGLGMRDGWMGAKLLITSSEQQGHFRVAFHHSSRSLGGSLLYVCAIWSTPAAAAADDDFQRVDRLKCDKHVTDVLALLPYWNFSLHFEISQTAQVGIWLDARRGKHEQQSRRFWLSLSSFFPLNSRPWLFAYNTWFFHDYIPRYLMGCLGGWQKTKKK